MSGHGRDRDPSGGSSWRITPHRVLALVIVALVVVFIVQNREPVDVRLFTLTVTATLWLLMVIMTAIGVIIGLLLMRRR